jgi:tetratricopeptide (TPR) repeat protein|tara:strand:- start:2339 stop:4042 length:1704 start_codon:yes stop_codon:yes gene_type:complete
MLKFLPHSIFLLIILSIAGMVRAEISFGGYLAGRHALSTKDFDAASTYLSRAIEDDLENPELLNGLISVQVSLGDIGAAKISSDNLDLLGVQTQLSNMVKIAIQLRNRDFDNAKQQIENEQGINPLLDKIVTGWAFADEGNFENAETIFDEIGKGSSLAQFSQMQKASMLAAYGRYESALNTIENLEKNSNRISIDARALKVQLLLKLDNKEEATEYFSKIFGDGVNSDAANLRMQVEDHPNAYSIEESLSLEAGIAYAFYAIADILKDDADPNTALLYVRLAQYLNENSQKAILLAADLLEQMGQYDLAVEEYAKISPSSSYFLSSELGRVGALRDGGKTEAALEVLYYLSREFSDIGIVHNSLGDFLRREERYSEAKIAYDRAVDIYRENNNVSWVVLYARGITHERLQEWDKAESDFRNALTINPDQANVLNYLGYSLIDRGEKLDEAMTMIEKAVSLQPESGYIVDSLAWGLFKLGQYETAIPHMEKAAELMPVDPIVTDHLGDLYWAVGRQLEAKFQWRRALSFDPELKDATRIREKLRIGLDRVLVNEGLKPTSELYANDK